MKYTTTETDEEEYQNQLPRIQKLLEQKKQEISALRAKLENSP